MIAEPAHLEQMLGRLKLTAIRDQLDSLLDEGAKGELTLRETLTLFCEREIARKDDRRGERAMSIAKFPYVRDLAGDRPRFDVIRTDLEGHQARLGSRHERFAPSRCRHGCGSGRPG
jgi:hypothetical protein